MVAPFLSILAIPASLAPASPAAAHAFLVRTEPGQGARLGRPPASIAIEFSERVPGGSAELFLARGAAGPREPVEPRVSNDGRVISGSFRPVSNGVYVVNWSVVAEDGHTSAGEFSFAVGAVTGTVPAARTGASTPSVGAVLASLLVVAGFAVAAGAVVWRRLGASFHLLVPLRSGLLAAEAGAVMAWAWSFGGPVRTALLAGASAAFLAIALLAADSQKHWLSEASMLAAALSWSARSQSAVANGAVGWLIDSVHLVAGSAWLGALVLLVIALARAQDRRPLFPLLMRYSRVAVGLVVVLGLAGTASAWLLLTRPSDLWGTGYGRLVGAKVALFAIALAAAAIARRRGLGRRNAKTLRHSVGAEVAALVIVVAVTAVVVNTSPPPPRLAAAALLGPAPMPGPVSRDAGLAGMLTVSVAANAERLQVEVSAPGGAAPDGLEVTLAARLPGGRKVDLNPRPCGRGCLTQSTRLPTGTTSLAVQAAAPDWPGGTYTAELQEPPPAVEPALLRRVVDTMSSVGEFKMTERTTSGPGSIVRAGTFDLDGMRFLELEPYAAGDADDVVPLGGGVRGLRLYLSGDRVWVTLWLDEEGRISRERIVSIGHEILRTFRYPEDERQASSASRVQRLAQFRLERRP